MQTRAKPQISTAVRWIEVGAPARDGTRVRLSAIRCGGRWLTSRAALREFTERLTARIEDFPALTPTRKRSANARTAAVSDFRIMELESQVNGLKSRSTN